MGRGRVETRTRRGRAHGVGAERAREDGKARRGASGRGRGAAPRRTRQRPRRRREGRIVAAPTATAPGGLSLDNAATAACLPVVTGGGGGCRGSHAWGACRDAPPSPGKGRAARLRSALRGPFHARGRGRPDGAGERRGAVPCRGMAVTATTPTTAMTALSRPCRGGAGKLRGGRPCRAQGVARRRQQGGLATPRARRCALRPRSEERGTTLRKPKGGEESYK